MDLNKPMGMGNSFPKGMKKAVPAYADNTKEGMKQNIDCNAVKVEKMAGFYDMPKAGKMDMKIDKVEKAYK